jgi:hypothetical protein
MRAKLLGAASSLASAAAENSGSVFDDLTAELVCGIVAAGAGVLLDAQGAGSVLTMSGPDGANLLMFSATPNGGVIQLQDQAGRDRVIVNGSSRPSIAFIDEQGAYAPWRKAPDEDWTVAMG